MKSRITTFILIAVAFAVGAALTLDGVMRRPVSRPEAATTGKAAIGGPFTLVATNGQTVSDQTYRGKWLLIFFGYTFCPDICPTTLANISVALKTLGSEASNLQPLFITIDPERDTAKVLADYLTSFDPRVIGLTGAKSQIDNVIKEYHVYVERQEHAGGDEDYLVSHSGYIYLMDPRGQFVNVIPGSVPGEQIAAWLRKQMAHPNERVSVQ